MENFSTSPLNNFHGTKSSNGNEIYQLLEDIQEVCAPSNEDISSAEVSTWPIDSLSQKQVPRQDSIGASAFISPNGGRQAYVENRYVPYYPTTNGAPDYYASSHSNLLPQIPLQYITMPTQTKLKHRAEISLVQTSRTQFKAIIKRKRKRTMFTTEQIEALEEIFKTKPYIIRKDREELADRLQISDKSVKVWFQNRRLKGKRRLSTDSNESILDYVESQIMEKADEFGYVTLDDKIMGDLVNVVDNLLNNTVGDTMTNVDSSPVYEPISPASVTDNEEYNLILQQPYHYICSNTGYL